MGPQRSPYSSRPARLHFRNRQCLYVITDLIKKYPKFLLYSDCNGEEYVSLDHFTGSAGHVLVQYLYTGIYQNLKNEEAPVEANIRDEFEISVEVYVLAGKYDVPILKDLAKGEMERLGPELEVTQLIDIMDETHPTPRADDVWLHDYIKSRVNSLPTNNSSPTKSNPSETLSMINFLLRAYVELSSEKMSTMSSVPASETDTQGSLKSTEKKRQAGNHTSDEARKGKKRKETVLQASDETEWPIKDEPAVAEE
ncbi:hypothetical protein GGR53DRAFT_487579 [Hypoxylon sp. FL1150]|nr:hypothetical protein GGR53DRAFT_487579 [Hypoxylon sp. FL1150]